jgi:mRNA-degrading endonuclease RelE of RelBE toxin-antitoxin system
MPMLPNPGEAADEHHGISRPPGHGAGGMSAGPGRRKVEISKPAAKGIQKAPWHVQQACKNVLREVAAGTREGKRLKGELSGLRSVRLGQYRLLYEADSKTIHVVHFGPRGDVYKG